MLETWAQVRIFMIGGLIQVGFGPQSDYLLVCSSQGRGVINCISGQKLARDLKEEFNELELTSEGIGPLEGQRIITAGLFGGKLQTTTADGRTLFERPERSARVFLKQNSSADDEAIFVGDGEVCELRSFGFSETGRSFLIATSCDLTIYSRIMSNDSTDLT